jgi:hypothetical protein
MPSPSLPLLNSYRRFPYAMRARMALLVAWQPFQMFEIELRDKSAVVADLLDVARACAHRPATACLTWEPSPMHSKPCACYLPARRAMRFTYLA